MINYDYRAIFKKYDLENLLDYFIDQRYIYEDLESLCLEDLLCHVETYKNDVMHFINNDPTVKQNLKLDRLKNLYNELCFLED